jgi:hypothetical protein
MMFSYWFLGNNQIYDNLLFPLTKVNDLVRHGHTVISELSDITHDQSYPCLIVCFALIICIPFGNLVATILSFIKPGVFEIKLNIDENLPNFYEALEEEDKKWMRSEESNLRKKYVSIS